MDDKLYYVESPDEQVLGPMTMMHVLEGVAAGVILESARICEVGAQEWVYLADVAYTREGESDPSTAAAPAEDYFGREEPAVATQPSWDRNPSWEEPAADADLGVQHGSAWQPDPEPARHEEPAAPEDPAPVSRARWVDETAPARAADAHAGPRFRAEEPHEEAAPVAVARADEFEAPFDDENESGASHDPFEEDATPATSPEGRRRRPRWLVPALAALALPAFAGAWLLSGRPLPFLASGEPAPAPAPEVSPLQQARELLVAGQAAEAMLRYESILAGEPDNAAALHGHGMAAMAAGDPRAATESLEKACSAEDSRPVWTADLARALHASGRVDSALQRIGAYLAEHPEDRENQVARLDWLVEAGRSAEAATLYTGLAKDNPVNAYHQYLAGLALGEDAAAETYLRRSVELDPAHGDAHAALGRLLAAKGAAAAAPVPAPAPKPVVAAAAPKPAPKKAEPAPPPAEAEKAAAAVAAAPKPKPKPAARPDFSAFAPRIRAELDRERFESARGILSEAREAAGSGRDARNNAGLWEGIIAFEEGRFDDALARFQALDASASYSASGFGNGAVANWIARVWFAKGDVRKAVSALDGVGPDDPDEYAMARLWEGLALATLGMDDLAARTWERIPADVGTRVRASGRGAVKSAELLTGSISEKEYRTAVAPVAGYGNDMYFFLAYAAKRKADEQAARENFARAVEESAGREFPYHLAHAQVTGEGILGGN